MQGVQLASDGENSKPLTVISRGDVNNSINAKKNGKIMNLVKVSIHS